MFTSIKQRDLNTPLLQRIEKRLLEKQQQFPNNAKPDIDSLVAESEESSQVCGNDISSGSLEEIQSVTCSTSVGTSQARSCEEVNESLNDSGKENHSQEVTSSENDSICKIQTDGQNQLTHNVYRDEHNESQNPNLVIKENNTESNNDNVGSDDVDRADHKSGICLIEGPANISLGRKKVKKKSSIKSKTKSKVIEQENLQAEIVPEKQKCKTCDNMLVAEEPVVNKKSVIHITKELLDNFHIQFEDDSPGINNVNISDSTGKNEITKKNQRRKSRRSMDFTPDKPMLLEPRESNGTPTLTPDCTKSNDNIKFAEICTKSGETSKATKKSRKRRMSADIEILNSEIKFSPDIELEGLDEMKTLPGTRRSRRLQRQSIEMCRRKPCSSISDLDDDEDPIAVSANQSNLSPFSLVGQVCSEEVENCGEGNVKDKENKRNSATELTGNNVSKNSNISENDIKSDKVPQCRKRAYTKRNVKTKVSYVEEDIVEVDVELKKPRVKTGKRKRKREEEGPSIEDIYLNKLWKKQMPDPEKTWETIYEIPQNNRGKEDFYSAKRYRRALSYEQFYTQQKLKRRRQKASKLGYKPLTKKKHEKFDQLVAEKLALLEDEMGALENDLDKPVGGSSGNETCDKEINVKNAILQEKQSANCNSAPDHSPRTEINEDAFYTPMKTIYDKEFVKESETSDKINDGKNLLSVHSHTDLNFADIGNFSMSDSEDVFQTPQKSPEHWKIRYKKVNEMSLIEEELDSSSGNNSQDFCLKT